MKFAKEYQNQRLIPSQSINLKWQNKKIRSITIQWENILITKTYLFVFCHRVLNRCPFDFLAILRSLDSACHPLRKIGEFFFVFPPQIPLEKHVMREWKVYRNLPLASYLIFTERDVFLYIKSRFGLAFVSHHPSHIWGFLREDFFFIF